MTGSLARSGVKKSLDGSAGMQRREKVAWRARWHAAALKSRLMAPLARSDSRMSH